MNKSNEEFNSIITDICENKEFNKLKDKTHHGISRYDHSMRVAYYTYLTTKFLKLNYKEATRGALLHDFFIDEVKDLSSINRFRKHPEYAVKNAKKYFEITKLEENIIKTHMFPITFTPPKYIESWLVDIIDDISSIYEKCFSIKEQIATAVSMYLIILFNYIR